jgi:hypothetical protein
LHSYNHRDTHMYITMLSYGAISCYSPCWFPFAISPCQFLPFLKSLLLTWNPSFCVVRSRPPWSQVARKLTSPSPFPPHSKFASPQGIPKLIVRPTKTTSRSRLRIVRNMYMNYKGCCLIQLFSYGWYYRSFAAGLSSPPLQ